jgi:membrane-associated protease RseP (regulator of RpoE activity)
MIWFFLLGLITYFVVQRLTGITRTSVWLLWLAAMLPAVLLAVWAIAYQGAKMPSGLVIVLFMGSLVFYIYLIQRGRITPRSSLNTAPPRPIDIPEKPPEVQQPESPVLRPITKAEEGELPGCFPWTVFYLQNIEYRPQAVVCRGQLRAKPEEAYQVVQENVARLFGDRFFVVLQEAPNQKPFFVLAPNPQAMVEGRSPRRLWRPRIAIALAVITIFTAAFAGLEIGGRVLSNPLIFFNGLPYAFAIMGFFGLRALGHYVTARKYNIAVTLPYFIPVIPLTLFPIGTLGAFSQIRSPVPDRKALFDMGAVGAMWGLCLAVPMLAWGLTESTVVGLSQRAGVLDYQAVDPRFSIVVAVFSKLVFGDALSALTAIRLHPIAAAGWFGLVFTTFNLIPIGQLDGGRIVHAMFGQRMGAVIGLCSKFLVLAFAIAEPYLRPWAFLLLLLPTSDEPALNDVTEVDSMRDAIGMFLLTFLLLMILPVPKAVAKWLGM